MIWEIEEYGGNISTINAFTPLQSALYQGQEIDKITIKADEPHYMQLLLDLAYKDFRRFTIYREHMIFSSDGFVPEDIYESSGTKLNDPSCSEINELALELGDFPVETFEHFICHVFEVSEDKPGISPLTKMAVYKNVFPKQYNALIVHYRTINKGDYFSLFETCTFVEYMTDEVLEHRADIIDITNNSAKRTNDPEEVFRCSIDAIYSQVTKNIKQDITKLRYTMYGVVYLYSFLLEKSLENPPCVQRCTACGRYFVSRRKGAKYCENSSPINSVLTCREYHRREFQLLQEKEDSKKRKQIYNNLLAASKATRGLNFEKKARKHRLERFLSEEKEIRKELRTITAESQVAYKEWLNNWDKEAHKSTRQ